MNDCTFDVSRVNGLRNIDPDQLTEEISVLFSIVGVSMTCESTRHADGLTRKAWARGLGKGHIGSRGALRKIIVHFDKEPPSNSREVIEKIIREHRPRRKKTIADALLLAKTQKEKLALIDRVILSHFGSMLIEGDE